MNKVVITIDKVNQYEWSISGLRTGYTLVPEQLLHQAVKMSLDGQLWPFKMDTRLPKMDQGGLIALKVERWR